MVFTFFTLLPGLGRTLLIVPNRLAFRRIVSVSSVANSTYLSQPAPSRSFSTFLYIDDPEYTKKMDVFFFTVLLMMKTLYQR
jgi:hypothetical protein